MGPWLLPVHWSFIWSSATKFTLGYVWWCGAFGSANVSRGGTVRGAFLQRVSAMPIGSWYRHHLLLEGFACLLLSALSGAQSTFLLPNWPIAYRLALLIGTYPWATTAVAVALTYPWAQR